MVMTCVFYIFMLYALARDWAVVGVLYGLYVLLGFFVGSSLVGSGVLFALGVVLSGILNFVALCGIVTWLRNRSSTAAIFV